MTYRIFQKKCEGIQHIFYALVFYSPALNIKSCSGYFDGYYLDYFSLPYSTFLEFATFVFDNNFYFNANWFYHQ